MSRPFPGVDVPLVSETRLMTQTWIEYFQGRTSGNYLTSSVLIGSSVALTSGAAKTITSLALPFGDWDIDSHIYINPAATTSITNYQGSISLVTNTMDLTPGNFFSSTINATVSGGAPFSIVIPSTRFIGGVTVFLVAQATFTVSTCSAYGTVQARRQD